MYYHLVHPHNVQQEKVRLFITNPNEFRHQCLITLSNRAEVVLKLEHEPYIEIMDKLQNVFVTGVVCYQC
jgi:hypothetical protein